VNAGHAVTDAAGVVLRRHDFLPFGEEWQPPMPSGETRLFTGKARDAETGLDYFGARYYEGSIGRFTTIDPPTQWSGGRSKVLKRRKGLFKKEPSDQAARYESHMSECEHCRVALQAYGYKRDVAEPLGHDRRH